MAISYSKGIREFEWPFAKAWEGLSKLYGTANSHLDSFTGRTAINGRIRGYCFSNGLEKSFRLNYEIILKNGVPTHLYDMRNQHADEMKNLLNISNVLREKLGLERQESQVINEFQQRVKTEREALRNVQNRKFSAGDKEVEMPLIPKNPGNKNVIITHGPPENEEGVTEKGGESKEMVEIVGDKEVDTGGNEVQLVKVEGDNTGEVLENEEVGDEEVVEPEEVGDEVGLGEMAESEDLEGLIGGETGNEEETPNEEEVIEEEPILGDEEQSVEEALDGVEEPETQEEGDIQEEGDDDLNGENVEDVVLDNNMGEEGVNDAGINDHGDVSVDPDLTQTEEDLGELNEFD